MQVRQKDEGLGLNPMLIEPIKAWAKFGSPTSDGMEVNRLAGAVRFRLLNLRVEVENMHTLRPLAFENRTSAGIASEQCRSSISRQSTVASAAPSRVD